MSMRACGTLQAFDVHCGVEGPYADVDAALLRRRQWLELVSPWMVYAFAGRKPLLKANSGLTVVPNKGACLQPLFKGLACSHCSVVSSSLTLCLLSCPWQPSWGQRYRSAKSARSSRSCLNRCSRSSFRSCLHVQHGTVRWQHFRSSRRQTKACSSRCRLSVYILMTSRTKLRLAPEASLNYAQTMKTGVLSGARQECKSRSQHSKVDEARTKQADPRPADCAFTAGCACQAECCRGSKRSLPRGVCRFKQKWLLSFVNWTRPAMVSCICSNQTMQRAEATAALELPVNILWGTLPGKAICSSMSESLHKSTISCSAIKAVA